MKMHHGAPLNEPHINDFGCKYKKFWAGFLQTELCRWARKLIWGAACTKMISGVQNSSPPEEGRFSWGALESNKAGSVDASHWDYLRDGLHHRDIKHHLYRRRAGDCRGKHDRGNRYRHRGASRQTIDRPRGERQTHTEPAGKSLQPPTMKWTSCAVKSSLSFLRHGRRRGGGSGEIKEEEEDQCESVCGGKSEIKHGRMIIRILNQHQCLDVDRNSFTVSFTRSAGRSNTLWHLWPWNLNSITRIKVWMVRFCKPGIH